MEAESYKHYDYMEEDFPFKIERRDNFTLNQRPHSHDYMQICYVIKGACTYSAYGKSSIVVKGDIFSVFPSDEHMFKRIDGKDIEIVQIDFMPYFINENIKEFSKLEGFVDFAYIQPLVAIKEKMLPKLNLSGDTGEDIEKVIIEIEAEVRNKEDGYKLAVKANLLKMLVLIGRQYKKFIAGGNGEKEISFHRALFYKSIKYIDENSHEKIQLDEMAKLSAMSPSYYSFLFKQIIGQSFIEYLNGVRIKKAMQLIKHTDKNITQICYETGFNNLTHFNRIFKSIAGVAPSMYKKNLLKTLK